MEIEISSLAHEIAYAHFMSARYAVKDASEWAVRESTIRDIVEFNGHCRVLVESLIADGKCHVTVYIGSEKFEECFKMSRY